MNQPYQYLPGFLFCCHQSNASPVRQRIRQKGMGRRNWEMSFLRKNIDRKRLDGCRRPETGNLLFTEGNKVNEEIPLLSSWASVKRFV